ncbi:LysR family transcriptional regulator [Alteromonas pelagimontana]|uniref:LysR family transcriptional regulator n=1 Tax=Alteromonas pelagimontana TaxID=1858656 RepID=A0A6M4MAF3_9ALTE|nr:LysR substrate-binding domain-containing protein [Alteromonas pelagimontana]QJR80154.1 LysR family transcriptional regulator [Alteromonas pelagimontana]
MRHAITFDAIRVLEAISQEGSFAAAAAKLAKVPSAITYTMQKLESDLGVLIFDRSKKRAALTSAGKLVLEEGIALLQASARLEEKVHQLESGWESKITIAKDTLIPDAQLLALIGGFCHLDKQVEITVIEEVLGGGWDALYTKRADIAIGLTGELPKGQFDISEMGTIEFVFAVARHHPLADFVGLLEPQHILQYPSIIVADSSRTLPGRSSGLFDSKQVIRVSSMQSKIQAQVLGVGIGFLPLHLINAQLASGELVAKASAIPRPPIPAYFATVKGKRGKALNWICQELQQQQWFK